MNGHLQALDQMLAAGMPDPGPLRADGRIVRYGPKKRAWYVLRELHTRAGSVVLVGAFGCWGRIESTRIEIDWRAMGEAEREDLQRRQAEVAARDLERRELRARQAAMCARDLWAAASREGQSSYLQRKQVAPESVRFLVDGMLVVPMIRYDKARDEALCGAQTIWPDGSKRFALGTAKRGCACRLGLVALDEPILICEGLATGLSIRMATKRRYPVFVAFDAYNLQPVGEILRALYPDSYIVFCADDDHATPGNPGRVQALKAARAIGNADTTHPIFRDRASATRTDFNDLHVTHGLPAVTRQIDYGLKLGKTYRHAA